jgi:hypothetical protein
VSVGHRALACTSVENLFGPSSPAEAFGTGLAVDGGAGLDGGAAAVGGWEELAGDAVGAGLGVLGTAVGVGGGAGAVVV